MINRRNATRACLMSLERILIVGILQGMFAITVQGADTYYVNPQTFLAAKTRAQRDVMRDEIRKRLQDNYPEQVPTTPFPVKTSWAVDNFTVALGRPTVSFGTVDYITSSTSKAPFVATVSKAYWHCVDADVPRNVNQEVTEIKESERTERNRKLMSQDVSVSVRLGPSDGPRQVSGDLKKHIEQETEKVVRSLKRLERKDTESFSRTYPKHSVILLTLTQTQREEQRSGDAEIQVDAPIYARFKLEITGGLRATIYSNVPVGDWSSFSFANIASRTYKRAATMIVTTIEEDVAEQPIQFESVAECNKAQAAYRKDKNSLQRLIEASARPRPSDITK